MLGLPFHPVDKTELKQILLNWIAAKEKHHVSVVDAHTAILSQKDFALREVIRNTSLNLSDSVPIYWLSKGTKKNLPCRISGYDLSVTLCELAASKGYKLFLLGSTPEILKKMVLNLKQRYPSLCIAGSFSPPFKPVFSTEENAEMIAAVNRSGTDILWVGLPAGKNHKWISENLEKLQCHIACGVGAAFDFFAGTKKRAPQWVQKMGMEWFFRVALEPRRLFKRYLGVNTRFLLAAAKELFRS